MSTINTLKSVSTTSAQNLPRPNLQNSSDLHRFVPSPNEENKENRAVVMCSSSSAAEPRTPEHKVVRYVRGSPLGEGSYGSVHRGTDPQNPVGSPKALKRNLPNQDAYDSVQRELQYYHIHAENGTRHHMPLVADYESTPQKGEDGIEVKTHTLVTPYVKGGDLCQIFDSENPLSPPVVKTVMKQLLEFTADSEKRGLVHNDLKPGNLYLLPSRQILVSDYGISEDANEKEPATLAVTASYRPPEEILGYFGFDTPPVRNAGWDIWSIGCIGLELFTGDELFPVRDTDDTVTGLQEHLQMIAFQIGMPTQEYLSKYDEDEMKNLFEFPQAPDQEIRLKNENKSLSDMKKWQITLARAAKEKKLKMKELKLLANLLSKIFQYTRPSAAELLQHEYFKDDIAFHLDGNFTAEDTVTITRESDSTPSIVIRNPLKNTNCLHIEQDKKYKITVEREGKEIYSEVVDIENEGEVHITLKQRAKKRLIFEKNPEKK